MFKSHFFLLSAAAAVLSLAACSKEKMDKVGDNYDLQGRYQTAPNDEISARVNGIGCVAKEFAVTLDKVTLTETAYAAAGCTGPALGQLITETTSKIGNELGTAPGARELDLTIAHVFVIPQSPDWTKILGVETSGDCNLQNVPVGAKHEVTGLKCGALGKLPDMGAVFFTSFVVEGDVLKTTEGPNVLPESVGSNAAPGKRALDLNVVYHRK